VVATARHFEISTASLRHRQIREESAQNSDVPAPLGLRQRRDDFGLRALKRTVAEQCHRKHKAGFQNLSAVPPVTRSLEPLLGVRHGL
jgi:hypothetical protein